MNKNIILYVVLCLLWLGLAIVKFREYNLSGDRTSLLFAIISVVLLVLNVYRIIRVRNNNRIT